MTIVTSDKDILYYRICMDVTVPQVTCPSDMFCICFSKSSFHVTWYSKSFVLAKWSVKSDWL